MNFLEVGRVERTHLGVYVTQERFGCVGRQNIARSRKKRKRLKRRNIFPSRKRVNDTHNIKEI